MRPARLLTLLLAVLGLGLLALLTLSHNSGTRIYAWPWWAGWRVLLAIPPLLLLGSALSGEQPGGRIAPGFLFLLIAGAAIQVLAAFLSAHPAESLGTAIGIVSMACLAIFLARTGATRHGLPFALAFGGALFSAVSLGWWLFAEAIPAIQRTAELNATIGADVFHLNPDGFRNQLPLGHANYIAGAALLALPWTLVWAWRTHGGRRALWAVATVMTLATLISSGSRGAILGLGVAAGFLLVAAAVGSDWSRRTILITASVGVVLFAVLAVAVPRVRHSVRDLAAGRGATIGDQQRLAMLRIGWDMGADRWWIGQGPGLVSRLYPRYRARVDGGTDIAYQLHSTPVQVWAETGLPGLALAGTLAAAALAVALERARRIREIAGREQRAAGVAAGISLAGYAGFALTDYQLDMPVFAAAVAANLAILAQHLSLNNAVGSAAATRGRTAVAAGAALVLVVSAWATFPELRARSVFSGAIHDLEQGANPAEFDARVVVAAGLVPDSPHYPAGAASAHLRLGYGSRDAASRPAHLNAARAWLKHTLAVEPDHELALFNLGWLDFAREPAEAAGCFRRSIHLLPDKAGVYLGLGLARLEAGDIDRAHHALALEILNDPIFITSPIWTYGGLAPHRAAVLDRALATATKFEAAFQGQAPESVVTTRPLLRWWLGDDAAVEDLAQVSTGPAKAFWQHLADGEKTRSEEPSVSVTTPGWQVLCMAQAHPETRRAEIARYLFIRRKTPATGEELDIIERVLARAGSDWRAWLQAPEGHEPPFVKEGRYDRTSYPILARNMDIPAAREAYLRQENLLAEWFFRTAFPPRGHLPDHLLLDHVADRDL